ncbi:BRF1-domain-containing protein [Lactarius psammicola]|nr:BRF1-domain-containing protein [Lactarius psammicola]
MATTYNYGAQYAFAQPENGFGTQRNANNVVCTDCGGTVIEYDAAAGNGFCVQCGTVVEENTIVNEVSFGETAAGAAMVQGSYVGQGATHARMGGPFGNRGNAESREQTIANANRKIQSIASNLRLSDVVSLAATRLYTLAVEHKFTKGRKSLNVVAVCLYVACRQKETRNYMLIDFSDLLQVNVFELGHTYLQLVQTLNLRLPLVDPSHYISRFAALLEFGDETHKVATDAIRLVQRFDRDWMTKGRRPAGICGACLLLAARMNNFRRSVEEIVQVVKIADTTLRKRLKEFKETPSGALTLADFRTVWLEEEMDPPAFIKGKDKEREGREPEAEEASGQTGKMRKRQSKADKRKRKRRRIGESDEEGDGGDHVLPSNQASHTTHLDPELLNSGILAGTSRPEPLFLPEPGEDLPDYQGGPVLLMEQPGDLINASSSRLADALLNNVLTEEVAEYLLNEQGAQLSAALDEVNERRVAGIQPVDELIGLDEEELDQLLLSEEEVRIKERVWVEMNREYLEAIAAKGEQREPGGTSSKHKKRRKPAMKPRDASTPHGSTAAESVRTLLKQNARYSKRINYDALKDLFTDEKDADLLFTLDEKDEDQNVVVEEGGGRVGGHAPRRRLIDAGDLQPDLDADDDADGSDKGDDYGGWEDTYEQEV